MLQEKIQNNLKKPRQIYMSDSEWSELRRGCEQVSLMINKKITLSQYIRLRLKLLKDWKDLLKSDGDGEK